MVLGWFKKRRRRQLLREPFPREWWEHLQHNLPLYRSLPPPLQIRLRDLVRIFVAEKEWVGCNGLELTDEIRVTIAAQACLLLLGFDDLDFCYDGVATILVYPGAFATADLPNTLGLVSPEMPTYGEAWQRGPVVLSWEHAAEGGRHGDDGRNLVIHEFAHQIDGLDGHMGGTPPLPSAQLEHRWQEVLESEYGRLVRHLQQGRPTLLDPYAATNRAEFFAVSTEFFFERPAELSRHHPAWYGLLRELYRIDPAHWTGTTRPLLGGRRNDDNDAPPPAQIHREPNAAIAARLAPGTADAWFTQAIAEMNDGRYAEAVASLTRAIHLAGDDGEAYQHRGLAHVRLGQYAEALSDCNQALRIDPGDIDAHRTRAAAFVGLGQYDDAIADANRAIFSTRDDAEAYYQRGLARMGLRQFSRAVGDFNQAIRFAPRRGELYLARSYAYDQLGRHRQAEADRREAYHRDPGLKPDDE